MSRHSKQEVEDLLNHLVKDTPMLLGLFGFTGKYEPDSLEALEEMITTLYPKEGPAKFDTTYMPLGFYLGETMVRNIPGAKWVIEDLDYIGQLAVSVPNSGDQEILDISADAVMKVYPFNRVRNFFHDHTDGLAVLFRMTLAISLGLLPKSADGEWVHLPNGDSFRVSKKPFPDKAKQD
jgi:hypothetical protein